MYLVIFFFNFKGGMALDKDVLRIVCVYRASVWNITTVSVELCNHQLIKNSSSSHFHLFYSLLKIPKWCRTRITVVDNLKILQLQDLREPNKVIRTWFRCSRHQFTFVYIEYDITNKRCIIEQQMKIINVIQRMKIVSVIKNLECFEYNRYMIPALRLHINRKLQNSGKAENQVKRIIKKIQLYEKVRATHSESFIM